MWRGAARLGWGGGGGRRCGAHVVLVLGLEVPRRARPLGPAERRVLGSTGGDRGEMRREGEGEEEGEGEGEEASEAWVAPAMSRFAFLARRPFHPARLHKLLK